MSTRSDSHWPVVARWMQGNQAALDLLQHLNHVVNVWDDLIDGDKPVDPAKINSAFTSALCHIPRNPFYQAHFSDLAPLVEVCIANWLAANEFEQSGTRELQARAHTLRFGGVDVMVMCARLIGGLEGARDCATELRALYPAESLDDYLQEVSR